MNGKHFKPSPKFLTKLRLIFTLVALIVLASGALLAWLLGRSSDVGPDGALATLIVTAALDVAWWLPAMLLSGAYYRSLHYEVEADEVIMRVGIITRSVKHVPYRTVTNITVKRGIFDRWLFGLGTLNIQTAGMSGTTGAEESLEGLDNVQELYDLVATELRKFRSAMSPTAAGVDAGEPDRAGASRAQETLASILTELQALRRAVETR